MGKTTKIDKQDANVTYDGTAWEDLVDGEESKDLAIDHDYGVGKLGFSIADNTGAGAKNLKEGTDYTNNIRMDTGSIDLYDDGDSGALSNTIRLVNDGENINKSSGGTLNLGLEIKARDFTRIFPQYKTDAGIDPQRGIFVLPRPNFWSKCENVKNLINPEINMPRYAYPGTIPILEDPSGHLQVASSSKFGDALNAHLDSTQGSIYYYPMGNVTPPPQFTLSMWILMYNSASRYPYFEINFDNAIGSYVYLKASNTSWEHRLVVGGVDEGSFSTDISSWAHLYIVADEEANLTDSKSVRVFINNSEVKSSTTSFSAANAIKFKWCTTSGGFGFNGETLFDNIKIWDHIVSEDPSWEYGTAGAGREEALHSIYGSGNDYTIKDLTARFYYIPSSIIPVLLDKPSGSSNAEVQLENVSDEFNGIGYFGGGHSISKSDYTKLVKDVDFECEEAMDGSGTSPDIYDDGDSGALTGLFRIVHDGENVAKTSGGTLNMSLVPIAKDLSSAVLSPPIDEVWIDPLKGKFILPRPSFWSKCENVNNLINANVGSGTTPDYGTTPNFISESGGKFGNCVRVYTNNQPAEYSGKRFYTGSTIGSAGTYSCWLKQNAGTVISQSASLVGVLSTNFYTNIQRYGLGDTHLYVIVDGNTITDLVIPAITTATHIYIVWDNAGIDGGSSYTKYYIDGVIKSNNTTYTIPTTGSIMQSLLSNVPGADIDMTIENIKHWDHAIDLPDMEYNSGTGREDSLHSIYGVGADYKPALTLVDSGGVGYYLNDSAANSIKWLVR